MKIPKNVFISGFIAFILAIAFMCGCGGGGGGSATGVVTAKNTGALALKMEFAAPPAKAIGANVPSNATGEVAVTITAKNGGQTVYSTSARYEDQSLTIQNAIMGGDTYTVAVSATLHYTISGGIPVTAYWSGAGDVFVKPNSELAASAVNEVSVTLQWQKQDYDTPTLAPNTTLAGYCTDASVAAPKDGRAPASAAAPVSRGVAMNRTVIITVEGRDYQTTTDATGFWSVDVVVTSPAAVNAIVKLASLTGGFVETQISVSQGSVYVANLSLDSSGTVRAVTAVAGTFSGVVTATALKTQVDNKVSQIKSAATSVPKIAGVVRKGGASASEIAPGATVRLYSATLQTVTATADSNGNFSFTGTFTAGQYNLSAELANCRYYSGTVTISSSDYGYEFSGVAVNMTTCPVPAITGQVVSGTGAVSVAFDLNDKYSNPADITFEYSLDGGTTYTVSSNVTGALSAVVPGTGKSIVWNSAAAFQNIQNNVRVRLTANKTTALGTPAVSTVFTVNNNVPTTIQNAALSGATFHGPVAVTYDLVSADADTSDIILSYSTDGVNFRKSVFLSGLFSSVPAGTGKSLTWNSVRDFDWNESQVRIKLEAFDGKDTGAAVLLGPVAVGNHLPLIAGSRFISDNVMTITFDEPIQQTSIAGIDRTKISIAGQPLTASDLIAVFANDTTGKTLRVTLNSIVITAQQQTAGIAGGAAGAGLELRPGNGILNAYGLEAKPTVVGIPIGADIVAPPDNLFTSIVPNLVYNNSLHTVMATASITYPELGYIQISFTQTQTPPAEPPANVFGNTTPTLVHGPSDPQPIMDITDPAVNFSNFSGYYIHYRFVDRAGNKTGWAPGGSIPATPNFSAIIIVPNQNGAGNTQDYINEMLAKSIVNTASPAPGQTLKVAFATPPATGGVRLFLFAGNMTVEVEALSDGVKNILDFKLVSGNPGQTLFDLLGGFNGSVGLRAALRDSAGNISSAAVSLGQANYYTIVPPVPEAIVSSVYMFSYDFNNGLLNYNASSFTSAENRLVVKETTLSGQVFYYVSKPGLDLTTLGKDGVISMKATAPGAPLASPVYSKSPAKAPALKAAAAGILPEFDLFDSAGAPVVFSEPRPASRFEFAMRDIAGNTSPFTTINLMVVPPPAVTDFAASAAFSSVTYGTDADGVPATTNALYKLSIRQISGAESAIYLSNAPLQNSGGMLPFDSSNFTLMVSTMTSEYVFMPGDLIQYALVDASNDNFGSAYISDGAFPSIPMPSTISWDNTRSAFRSSQNFGNSGDILHVYTSTAMGGAAPYLQAGYAVTPPTAPLAGPYSLNTNYNVFDSIGLLKIDSTPSTPLYVGYTIISSDSNESYLVEGGRVPNIPGLPAGYSYQFPPRRLHYPPAEFAVSNYGMMITEENSGSTFYYVSTPGAALFPNANYYVDVTAAYFNKYDSSFNSVAFTPPLPLSTLYVAQIDETTGNVSGKTGPINIIPAPVSSMLSASAARNKITITGTAIDGISPTNNPLYKLVVKVDRASAVSVYVSSATLTAGGQALDFPANFTLKSGAALTGLAGGDAMAYALANATDTVRSVDVAGGLIPAAPDVTKLAALEADARTGAVSSTDVVGAATDVLNVFQGTDAAGTGATKLGTSSPGLTTPGTLISGLNFIANQYVLYTIGNGAGNESPFAADGIVPAVDVNMIHASGAETQIIADSMMGVASDTIYYKTSDDEAGTVNTFISAGKSDLSSSGAYFSGLSLPVGKHIFYAVKNVDGNTSKWAHDGDIPKAPTAPETALLGYSAATKNIVAAAPIAVQMIGQLVVYQSPTGIGASGQPVYAGTDTLPINLAKGDPITAGGSTDITVNNYILYAFRDSTSGNISNYLADGQLPQPYTPAMQLYLFYNNGRYDLKTSGSPISLATDVRVYINAPMAGKVRLGRVVAGQSIDGPGTTPANNPYDSSESSGSVALKADATTEGGNLMFTAVSPEGNESAYYDTTTAVPPVPATANDLRLEHDDSVAGSINSYFIKNENSTTPFTFGWTNTSIKVFVGGVNVGSFAADIPAGSFGASSMSEASSGGPLAFVAYNTVSGNQSAPYINSMVPAAPLAAALTQTRLAHDTADGLYKIKVYSGSVTLSDDLWLFVATADGLNWSRTDITQNGTITGPGFGSDAVTELPEGGNIRYLRENVEGNESAFTDTGVVVPLAPDANSSYDATNLRVAYDPSEPGANNYKVKAASGMFNLSTGYLNVYIGNTLAGTISSMFALDSAVSNGFTEAAGAVTRVPDGGALKFAIMDALDGCESALYGSTTVPMAPKYAGSDAANLKIVYNNPSVGSDIKNIGATLFTVPAGKSMGIYIGNKQVYGPVTGGGSDLQKSAGQLTGWPVNWAGVTATDTDFACAFNDETTGNSSAKWPEPSTTTKVPDVPVSAKISVSARTGAIAYQTELIAGKNNSLYKLFLRARRGAASATYVSNSSLSDTGATLNFPGDFTLDNNTGGFTTPLQAGDQVYFGVVDVNSDNVSNVNGFNGGSGGLIPVVPSATGYVNQLKLKYNAGDYTLYNPGPQSVNVSYDMRVYVGGTKIGRAPYQTLGVSYDFTTYTETSVASSLDQTATAGGALTYTYVDSYGYESPEYDPVQTVPEAPSYSPTYSFNLNDVALRYNSSVVYPYAINAINLASFPYGKIKFYEGNTYSSVLSLDAAGAVAANAMFSGYVMGSYNTSLIPRYSIMSTSSGGSVEEHESVAVQDGKVLALYSATGQDGGGSPGAFTSGDKIFLSFADSSNVVTNISVLSSLTESDFSTGSGFLVGAVSVPAASNITQIVVTVGAGCGLSSQAYNKLDVQTSQNKIVDAAGGNAIPASAQQPSAGFTAADF